MKAWTVTAWTVVVGGIGAAMVMACDDEEVALGPPRCEPQEELELERFLKEGYRALVEGRIEEAKIRFNAVLVEQPTHPEAQLGMRLAKGGKGIAPSQRTDAGKEAQGSVLVAGELVGIGLPIERVRYRFEDVSARRKYAFAQGIDERRLPLEDWYSARIGRDGKPVDGTSRGEIEKAVDLIVLHDTRTLDAREAMAQMEATGASTHFLVDWNGTVYQTLDLAFEANHAHQDAIDHRSVAIDIVNPVALESGPLPESAKAGIGERPLSEFVEVQGQETQAWGYTSAQWKSLVALVRALGEVLPAVAMQVPKGAGGKTPRAFTPGLRDFVGVLGHLHLSPKAVDPGPGFDWEALGRGL